MPSYIYCLFSGVYCIFGQKYSKEKEVLSARKKLIAIKKEGESSIMVSLSWQGVRGKSSFFYRKRGQGFIFLGP